MWCLKLEFQVNVTWTFFGVEKSSVIIFRDVLRANTSILIVRIVLEAIRLEFEVRYQD
jgi:hypothetical protein